MENDLLERAADLVMDAGQTLLENGGEVFRVQQTMEIMAHSLGVRDFHVYVLTNGIFASASMGSTHNVSLIRHVPSVSIHLGRVEAINELSRELAAGRLGVEEAEACLQQARSVPRTSRASGWPASSARLDSPTFLAVNRWTPPWLPWRACWKF